MAQQNPTDKRKGPLSHGIDVINNAGDVRKAIQLARVATGLFNPWVLGVGAVLVFVVFFSVLTGGGTGSALDLGGGGSGGTTGNGGSAAGGTVGTEYGWPTTGRLTQGPLGASSHAKIWNDYGGQSVDIADAVGTKIYSTIKGTAQVLPCSGSCNTGYGNEVDLTGSIPAGSFTVKYGHFSKLSISSNSPVEPGTLLGYMGSTGDSTGPHLHFEFRNLSLAPSNIPLPITPSNCDSDDGIRGIPCIPGRVDFSITAPQPTTSPQDQYWFVLNRQTHREYLYKGEPRNKQDSILIRSMTVNPGVAGKTPTPLPTSPPGYWTINIASVDSPIKDGTHFLILNIPFENSKAGPIPYAQCPAEPGGQCDWSKTPGAFGLHGSSDQYPVDRANPNGTYGSGGCIRHYYTDIVWLWDTLNATINAHKYDMRYYIDDGWVDL